MAFKYPCFRPMAYLEDKINEKLGSVSKDTVVLRPWATEIQNFGFINSIDKSKVLYSLSLRLTYIFYWLLFLLIYFLLRKTVT